MNRRLLILLLAVSLAFNIGFGITFGLGLLKSKAAAPSCMASDEQPSRFRELSARLQQELTPLRTRQAGQNRRLAELLAAVEPDRQLIDSTLDSLAATERSIHGLVVETILAQQEVLPIDQREEFCRHVHRRLCDPWVGCGAPCDTEHLQHSDHGDHSDHSGHSDHEHDQQRDKPKEDS